MASPLDPTVLQRLQAAREESHQQHQVIINRLTNPPFKLQDRSAEALREAASHCRTSLDAIMTVINAIGQGGFTSDDADYVRHVADSLSEPIEDLDGALAPLEIPKPAGQLSPDDGYDLWLAEWGLALTRFRHAHYGVLVQARAVVLILMRRLR